MEGAELRYAAWGFGDLRLKKQRKFSTIEWSVCEMSACASSAPIELVKCGSGVSWPTPK